MNVHISYKIPKTPEVEREITHLIEKLQNRLQVFRPELIHLKGSLEHNSDREGTVVALNLRLPSGQMAVQESASNPAAAIKAALDDMLALTRQIQGHTIEKTMTKNDLELGIEAILGPGYLLKPGPN